MTDLACASPMASDALELPQIRLRGRTFMALVVAPQFPMASWFQALDQQMRLSPSFFAERPVVADLASAIAVGGPATAPILLEGLEARNLRLVGVEGVEPHLLEGTRWERLPKAMPGRELALQWRQEPSSQPGPSAPPQSLLIDRPVRSGQSIVCEDGDVTIVGPVASGAEVIAGGSIHVYGVLRGRAIAGLRAGAEARIFCQRLEAEFLGVDRLYRTAENWGPALHGRAAQVFCDRGALRLSTLD